MTEEERIERRRVFQRNWPAMLGGSMVSAFVGGILVWLVALGRLEQAITDLAKRDDLLHEEIRERFQTTMARVGRVEEMLMDLTERFGTRNKYEGAHTQQQRTGDELTP